VNLRSVYPKPLSRSYRRDDVDPRADERTEYELSCRVFRTDAGFVPQPSGGAAAGSDISATPRRSHAP